MIGAIILAFIAVACLIYSIIAFQEKGPMLTTIYLLANPKQRNNMKTKENYTFVAIVFLMLSIIFFLTSIGVFFNLTWVLKVMIGLSIILGVYAVAFSIRSEARKK